MRHLRILKQGVWYEIRTCINNREPLFRRYKALAVFAAVFRETEMRFAFRIQGLRLEDDRLEFYIRPEDGEELRATVQPGGRKDRTYLGGPVLVADSGRGAA
jgi:hypothetical protein